MRATIDTLRYRWLGPSSGGVSALLSGRWIAAAVAALAVFACFFAIGRTTRSAVAPAATTAATQLEAAASGAPIPVGLSGQPPVAGAVPAAILLKPRPAVRSRKARRAAVRPARTATQVTTTAVAAPETQTAPAASSVQPKPAPRSEPGPTPVPASSPSTSGGSGSQKKAAAGSGGKSSGGGSFDTSE
jgi:translation initiation factor IF-2